MYKPVMILCGLLAFGNCLTFAQSSGYSFTITGTINVDTGKVALLSVSSEDYYFAGNTSIETEIVHGRFHFSGKIPGPSVFQILLKTSNNNIDYVSDIFYINSGSQMIRCNVDSLRETPTIINGSMLEYKNDYLPGHVSARDKFDDNERRNIEMNKFLIEYIKFHPDSYVALWQIIIALNYGYAADLDSAYEQLSNKVKNSYTGTVLKRRLKDTKLASVGQRFPELNLSNEQGLKTIVPPKKNLAKFTLIDFWFSHCPPCLEQFPQYKEINESFKDRGLKIIFISTDSKKNVPAWKNVIRDSALTWAQYLDENGTVSNKLGIQWVPSNFLLDSTGKIIAKNIEPPELRKYLDQNCN